MLSKHTHTHTHLYIYIYIYIYITTSRLKYLFIMRVLGLKKDKLANRFRSSLNGAKSWIILNKINLWGNIGWRKKNCIGHYIEIWLSPSRHSLFTGRRSAQQDMKCLQYFLMEWRVWLAQCREQVDFICEHSKSHNELGLWNIQFLSLKAGKEGAVFSWIMPHS